jgi:hypothetical protein
MVNMKDASMDISLPDANVEAAATSQSLVEAQATIAHLRSLMAAAEQQHALVYEPMQKLRLEGPAQENQTAGVVASSALQEGQYLVCKVRPRCCSRWRMAKARTGTTVSAKQRVAKARAREHASLVRTTSFLQFACQNFSCLSSGVRGWGS